MFSLPQYIQHVMGKWPTAYFHCDIAIRWRFGDRFDVLPGMLHMLRKSCHYKQRGTYLVAGNLIFVAMQVFNLTLIDLCVRDV